MAHLGSTPRCRQHSPGRMKAEQMKQLTLVISRVQCDRWMGRQLDLHSSWLAAAPALTPMDHFTGNGSSSWVGFFFWQFVGILFFFPLGLFFFLFLCLFHFLRKH